MILRFHLFVSISNSIQPDLNPSLVQSGLWHLQIIASFEEHFSILQTHTQSPRPGYGCLYSALCADLSGRVIFANICFISAEILIKS